MKNLSRSSIIGVAILFFASCSTPTLVEVARRGQVANNGNNVKDDVTVPYHITDRDVLNFTDEVKRKLANRSNVHMGIRYGSASAQATLGALAGAAETAGWSASVASGFGMGATYIFGLGQIFDSKDKAQTYETAYTAIDKAESTYYLHQVGYAIETGADGKPVPVYHQDRDHGDQIPNRNKLTFDGETLYYRVVKTLKVLDDALAQKIPNLQDLKDSQGDSSGAPPSPAKPTEHNVVGKDSQKVANTATNLTPKTVTNTNTLALDEGNKAALRAYLKPGGVENPEHRAAFQTWLDENEQGIDPATFINNSKYVNDHPKAIAKLIQ